MIEPIDRRGPSRGWGSSPLALTVLVPAALLAISGDRALFAQAPGPPTPVAQDEEPHSWKGSVDFGLTITEGNSESLSVSFGGEVSKRSEGHRFGGSLSYVRSTRDGQEVADQGALQGGYDYFATERFFLASVMRAEFNDPAGLSRRLAPGLGVGYTLVDGEETTVSVQGGGNWIQDRFVDESTSEAVYLAFRESLELTVSETTRLVQELRYNPQASDLSDYLLHGEVTLTTRISELIGLRVTFRDDYDSTPFSGEPGAPPRKKNDLTLITGVSFQF